MQPNISSNFLLASRDGLLCAVGASLLGLMLVIDGQYGPRLRSNPLALGNAKLEEFSDHCGETTRMDCQETELKEST